MRRSKFEMKMDILQALNSVNHLKVTHLLYKTGINFIDLRDGITFLIKKDLVNEEKSSDNFVVYKITEKGKHIVTLFRELDSLLAIEEGTEYPPIC